MQESVKTCFPVGGMELLQEKSKRPLESSSDGIHKSIRVSEYNSGSIYCGNAARENEKDGIREDAASLVPVRAVTVGIIALNEERYLPKLLDQILQQTYSLKNIELILVDSGSKDHTKELMKEFQSKHESKFENIKVLDNPKKIQAAGWNVVIENMSCDALIRLDAHAMIPKDFVEKNVACLNSGEYVCGGPRTNVIDGNTCWKRTLLTAEQSMFGSGIAPYRRSTHAKKYVNSVFHTCYRKEVIQRVGLFNEELLRTEDNEYHYRVRKAGYRICYDETIQSFYQTRNTLRGMIKQKYGNGFWIGKTVKVCPKCLSLYHLVPGAFVTLLVITGVIGTVGYPLWLELIGSLYAVVSLVLSIACLIKDKGLITDLALIVIFPLLHISYGVGTVLGLI